MRPSLALLNGNERPFGNLGIINSASASASASALQKSYFAFRSFLIFVFRSFLWCKSTQRWKWQFALLMRNPIRDHFLDIFCKFQSFKVSLRNFVFSSIANCKELFFGIYHACVAKSRIFCCFNKKWFHHRHSPSSFENSWNKHGKRLWWSQFSLLFCICGSDSSKFSNQTLLKTFFRKFSKTFIKAIFSTFPEKRMKWFFRSV